MTSASQAGSCPRLCLGPGPLSGCACALGGGPQFRALGRGASPGKVAGGPGTARSRAPHPAPASHLQAAGVRGGIPPPPSLPLSQRDAHTTVRAEPEAPRGQSASAGAAPGSAVPSLAQRAEEGRPGPRTCVSGGAPCGRCWWGQGTAQSLDPGWGGCPGPHPGDSTLHSGGCGGGGGESSAAARGGGRWGPLRGATGVGVELGGAGPAPRGGGCSGRLDSPTGVGLVGSRRSRKTGVRRER